MKKAKLGKAEQILRDMGKSIDELIEKAKNSKGDLKNEMSERIDELKRNRETLESKFKSFREDHAQDFDRLENSLQKAADEVKETLQNFFKKSKEKRP